MIHPPPNQHAAAARTAMQQHNAAVSQLRAAPVAPLQEPRLVPLWSLDAKRRWHVEAHDDGVWLWVDDDASLDAPRSESRIAGTKKGA